MRSVELSIRGHVQGVGFRWAMRAEAERLGVTGWVRNRRDGTVEARVTGTSTAVDAIVSWASQGPPLARVERVEARETDTDATNDTAFEIRASA